MTDIKGEQIYVFDEDPKQFVILQVYPNAEEGNKYIVYFACNYKNIVMIEPDKSNYKINLAYVSGAASSQYIGVSMINPKLISLVLKDKSNKKKLINFLHEKRH